MSSLGSVSVEVRAEIQQFENGLTQARQQAQAFDAQLNQLNGGSQAFVRATENAQRASSAWVRATQEITAAESRVSSSASSRGADVEAYGRELDRLRGRFDPVFAASQRYETELNELNRALQVGAINAGTHGRALAELNGRYQSAAAGANIAAGSARALSTAYRGSSFATANLAAQFNDLTVVTQAGQDPLQIALQQGTQIGQVFTQVGGGVRGAATALAAGFRAVISPVNLLTIGVIAGGAALTQWAFSSDEAEDETRTLADTIDDLESSTSSYIDAVEAANQNIDELTERYGSAAIAAREILEAQRDLERVLTLENLDTTANRLADTFGSLSRVADEAFAQFSSAGQTAIPGLDQLRDAIDGIQSRLMLSNDEALEFAFLLSDLRNAEGPAATARAFTDVQRFIEESIGSIEVLDSETRTLVSSILNGAESANKLAAQIDGTADALSIAIQQADQLNDAISGAANAAQRLADNSQNSLAAAQARLDFRSDPVGLAGELAGQRFDARVGDTSGFDPVLQQGFEAQRQAAVDAAEAGARLNEEIRTLNRLDREAASEATRRGRVSIRASNSAFNARQREIQGFEDLLARTESQTNTARQLTVVQQQLNPLIDTYERDLAEARKEQELLASAQRNGIDINEQFGDTTRTVAEEIERLSGSYADARDAARRLSEQQQEAQQTQMQFEQSVEDGAASFASDFLGGIREGESVVASFRDTALNAFSSIADQLIQIAARNLVTNAFGGALVSPGGFGGLLGSFFGGFRQNGGPVNPNQAFVVGEAGPELFVPSTIGNIVPNSDLQAANSNSAGQVVSIRQGDVVIQGNADSEAIQRIERQMAEQARQLPQQIAQVTRRQQLRGVS